LYRPSFWWKSIKVIHGVNYNKLSRFGHWRVINGPDPYHKFVRFLCIVILERFLIKCSKTEVFNNKLQRRTCSRKYIINKIKIFIMFRNEINTTQPYTCVVVCTLWIIPNNKLNILIGIVLFVILYKVNSFCIRPDNENN